MIVGNIRRLGMMQTSRNGAHFRPLAGQITLTPVRAAILRNENSLLGGGVNGWLRVRTKAQRNVGNGCGKREKTHCSCADHLNRLSACQKQSAIAGGGMWIHPEPARNLGQGCLFLPALSVVARNKERGTLFRPRSGIQDV